MCRDGTRPNVRLRVRSHPHTVSRIGSESVSWTYEQLGSQIALERRGRDGKLVHRPGRDVTLSAPKSVLLAALVGGDLRVVDVHDRAVAATLACIEGNTAETRMKDPATGRMVRRAVRRPEHRPPRACRCQ